MTITNYSLNHDIKYQPSIDYDVFQPNFKQCKICKSVYAKKSIDGLVYLHYNRTFKKLFPEANKAEYYTTKTLKSQSFNDQSINHEHLCEECNSYLEEFYEENQKNNPLSQDEIDWLMDVCQRSNTNTNNTYNVIKLCIGCNENKKINEFNYSICPLNAFWSQVCGVVGMRSDVMDNWGILCKECENPETLSNIRHCIVCSTDKQLNNFPIYEPQLISFYNCCWDCYKNKYLQGDEDHKKELSEKYNFVWNMLPY